MRLHHLFKGLADPIRLRIVHLLVQKGELCVCHLTDTLELPQSTISRHLNTLKNAGLVEAERRGQWVYYRMQANQHLDAISELLKNSAEDDEQLQNDLARLKESVC
jgi:ArsR family transcriptional regulator